MGSKGSPPPAPNYAELIPLQEKSNINQFRTMLNASRVNTVTPFGTTTWIRPGQSQQVTGRPAESSTPKVQGGTSTSGEPSYESSAQEGPWQLIQQLSPEQQRLYEQDLRIREGQGGIAEGMLANVRDTYGRPVNFAGMLPGFEGVGRESWRGPSYQTDINSRDAAERALYGRATRYLDPQMREQERALHERLLSQGFNINDPAYQKAMDEFARQRERAYADAREAAIVGGGQEATGELQRGLAAEQARFGAGMQGAQFDVAEKQRALQHALQNINLSQQDRARLLNELNAFRTGQQVQLPGLPAQFSTPNLQGIDHLGLANQNYQNQLNAWNYGQAADNMFLSGLMGLAGTALGGPMGGYAAQKLFGR